MRWNKEEKGQAIFEFIVFLPFFLTFIFLLVSIGGSISGAINQQKATRGYFFYSIKGNSMIPNPDNLKLSSNYGVQSAGFYAFGWKEYTFGINTPVAPCFRIHTFAGGEPDEECDDPGSGSEENRTNYVRIRTMFGVCTALYELRDEIIERREGDSEEVNNTAACTYR